jgi:ubiquinone/menaquinone biosynthesis C-methylase UbiE
MDLFEYEDVAEDYDKWVDLTDAHRKNFIPFHLELAKNARADRILDIACGTGAVTIPLLEAGYSVTALDLSSSMLNVLQKKLAVLPQDQGTRCTILCANMTEFKVKEKFPLAFIARSGFIHLISPEDQRKALANIHSHLLNNGILAFNTFDPHYEFISDGLKGKTVEPFLRCTYTNSRGNQERVFNQTYYDPMTQICDSNWVWEELDGVGKILSKRERPLRIRWTFKKEMEYLLELSGFKVLNVYGSYDKEPPAYGKWLIWVCQKN